LRPPSDDGITTITVDVPRITDFVHAVYIAPNSPDWYVTTVEDLNARINVDLPVVKSKLDAPPKW